MRSLFACFVGAAILGGVAHAQVQPSTTPAAAESGKGYVEGIAQSAFGNVTSQSYGAEAGWTLRPNLQVFGEFGWTRNVAPPATGDAAQQIATFLNATQTGGVSYTVKVPAEFGIAGVRYGFPGNRPKGLLPYVAGGAGFARVKRDVHFIVAGSDITSVIDTGQDNQYGVSLGSDLAGSTNSAMIVIGAGVVWPAYQRLIVDIQYRYGRIFDKDEGINLNRVGAGIGVRF